MNVMVSLPMQMFLRDLRNGDPTGTRDCMQGLEELGYWGVNVVDHILRSDTDVAEHHQEPDWNWRFPDALSTLGYLAACTSTLRLGIRILVVPYRSPFSVAHAVATVDSLSGGRMVLGVAPGYDRSEFERMGVPRSERGKITDEYLEIMFKLWGAEEPVDHEGKYHSFTGAQLQVSPVQRPRPPIWVGGNGRVGLRRAIRFGDGWTPSIYPYTWPSASDGVQITRDLLTELLAEAATERAAAGLAPLQCIPSAGMPVTFTDRPEHPGRRTEEIQQFSVRGTPEELIDEFRAFSAAGCAGYVIRLAGETPQAFLRDAEMFAQKVLPFIDSGGSA